MLLILSRKSPLVASFGAAACDQLVGLMREYADTVSASGARAALAVLDDAGSMAEFGLAPAGDSQATVIRARLKQIGAICQLRGDPITHLLLSGGDDVIPFFRLPNPVTAPDIDPDRVVLSDNPYGFLDEPDDWLAPTIPVGRICDGGGGNAFAASLRALIANRRTPPPRTGSCAVVNEDWATASASVTSLLGDPLDWRLTPFYSVTSGNRADLNHRILYFNLHGFDGDPGWKSYDRAGDRFLNVVTPDSFTPENVAGSLVISEACYGGQVVARTPRDSCALQLQSQGALAVIAATGLVFGSVLQPWLTIDNADQLVPAILGAAVSGQPVGGMVAQGRRRFLVDKCNGAPNPYERKTALQFILLGDPSVTLP
jgi:hypothetical protein